MIDSANQIKHGLTASNQIEGRFCSGLGEKVLLYTSGARAMSRLDVECCAFSFWTWPVLY